MLNPVNDNTPLPYPGYFDVQAYYRMLAVLDNWGKSAGHCKCGCVEEGKAINEAMFGRAK